MAKCDTILEWDIQNAIILQVTPKQQGHDTLSKYKKSIDKPKHGMQEIVATTNYEETPNYNNSGTFVRSLVGSCSCTNYEARGSNSDGMASKEDSGAGGGGGSSGGTIVMTHGFKFGSFDGYGNLVFRADE